MMLAAFIALAPSPIRKIEADVPTKPVVAHTAPVAVVAAVSVPESQPVVKSFDPADKTTWPQCADDEYVWADDGKCHKKPVAPPVVAQAAPKPVVAPPKPAPVVRPAAPAAPTGGKYAWMAAAGIAAKDYPAVDYIVSHEGSWAGTLIRNNEGSGAYGLCQALPASKMASAGSDYLTNPVTQLRWCSGYAASRYGGWWGAYSFWVSHRWW